MSIRDELIKRQSNTKTSNGTQSLSVRDRLNAAKTNTLKEREKAAHDATTDAKAKSGLSKAIDISNSIKVTNSNVNTGDSDFVKKGYSSLMNNDDFAENSKSENFNLRSIASKWYGIDNATDDEKSVYNYLSNTDSVKATSYLKDMTDTWKSREQKRTEDKIDNAYSYYGYDQLKKNTDYANQSADNTEANKFLMRLQTTDKTSYSMNYATDEEKAAYNYIYATEGYKAAREYLETMKPTWNKRENSEKETEAADKATSSVGSAILHSAESVLGNTIGGIAAFGEDVNNVLHGRDANSYSQGHQIQNQASSIREAVGDKIAENTNLNVAGVNAAQFAYDTGLSIAESYLGATLFGEGFTAIMGMSAAAQRAKELQDEGASNEEVVLGAGLAGIAESFFEKFSIEHFIKTKSTASVLIGVQNTLKQMGIEASEEMATEIANTITDYLVRGGTSDYEGYVKDYIDNGYSEDDARSAAKWQVVKNVAIAGIGGAASGGVMGGLGSFQGLITNTETGKQANKILGKDATSKVQESYRETLGDKAESYGLKSNVTNAELGSMVNESYQQALTDIEEGKKNGDTDRVNKGQKDLNRIRHIAYQDTESDIKARAEASEASKNGKEDYDTALINAYSHQFDNEKLGEAYRTLVGDNDPKAVYDSVKAVYHLGTIGGDSDNVTYLKGDLSLGNAAGIYEMGLKYKSNQIQRQQDYVISIGQKYNTSGKVGKVTTDSFKVNGVSYDGVNMKSASTYQKNAVLFNTALAAVTGADIHFYDSNGDASKANGFRIGNDIYVDVHAGVTKENVESKAILATTSHEFTHWMETLSPSLWDSYKSAVLKTVAEEAKITTDDVIALKILSMQESSLYKGKKISRELAESEITAEASEKMLMNSKYAESLLSSMTETKRKTIVDKINEILAKIKNIINDLRGVKETYHGYADIIEKADSEIGKLQKMWDEMLESSVILNQNLSEEGYKELGKKIDSLHTEFNARITDEHIEKLEKLGASFDLISGYKDMQEMWGRISESVSSDFLNDWNNKKGEDRVFSIFKAQSGYKYNVEFSSMCRKGVPLFDAIDKIVEKVAFEELGGKPITKTEKEYLYKILKRHGFDIPCAICYVEQARQREGIIINAFLNGADAMEDKPAKLGWNSTLDRISEMMKTKGVDYDFGYFSENIKNDSYKRASLKMDEKTQNAFFESILTIANEEIEKYNADKTHKTKRQLMKEITPASVKKSLGGNAGTNMKLLKDLIQHPNDRLKFHDYDLYSSITTENLARSHKDLYSLFNQQGGVSGYKTKQRPVIYLADLLNKKWSSKSTKDAGGIRNQSNSDFQTFQFLDYFQMFVDMTYKQSYYQAYTKTIEEAKLFGLSNAKINLSFIPLTHIYYLEGQYDENGKQKADVEKTMKYAGLDENMNPIFDDIEGINSKEALNLLKDKDYTKSVCGISIGFSDEHIRVLLDYAPVQMIIGYHDKTNDPSKRFVKAKYAKNYNGLNEATQMVDGKPKTVHIQFDQYIEQAEKMVGRKSVKYAINGVVRDCGYDMIPKLAAQLYKDDCKSKGYEPAYNIEGIVDHENYYKLLADFGLYDSEGHYAPHKSVTLNIPKTVPIYSNDGVTYESTEKYITDKLGAELDVRDSLASELAEDGNGSIIDDFRKAVRSGYVEETEGYDFGVQNSDRETNDNLANADNTAIYIKNTNNVNYIDLIFNGKKTEETRSTRSLDAFMGKKFEVTDGNYVYGTIVLGDPRKILAKDFHKTINQKKHRVPIGDDYDVKAGKFKWAYPIESYSKYDVPKKLSDSKDYKYSYQARETKYSDRESDSLIWLNTEEVDYEKKAKYLEAVVKRQQSRYEQYVEKQKQKEWLEKMGKNYSDLLTWMRSPDVKKNHYVPNAMRKPVMELIDALDFSSKRLINGGEPTKNDVSLTEALVDLHDYVANFDTLDEWDAEKYQIPAGFAEELTELVKQAKELNKIFGDNETLVRNLTSEQMETINNALKLMKHIVLNGNKLFKNARYQKASDAGDISIQELGELGQHKNSDDNPIIRQAEWANTLPIYAFQRIGSVAGSMFKSLQTGWSEYAFKVKEIQNTMNSICDPKTIKEWTNETVEYNDYTMTVPQAMSLWCLLKEPDAVRHIAKGGLLISEFGKGANKTQIQTTSEIDTSDLQKWLKQTLTKEQIKAADSIQEYFNRNIKDWGNATSEALYGIDLYTTPNYFPIKVDTQALGKGADNYGEEGSKLSRLLNQSFTKARNSKATVKLVVNDIFDIYTSHTTDMAKYSTLGLPVLDTLKWFSYVQKGKERADDVPVQRMIDRAFGKGANDYVRQFLEDLNETTRDSREALFTNIVKTTKMASVAFNIRVALLQPTAYVRAASIISPKYLLSSIGSKGGAKRGAERNGIFAWKSMGYYDMDVNRSLQSLIKGGEDGFAGFRDKVGEYGLKGAELGDTMTWGWLYSACEKQIAGTTSLEGKEYREAVNDLFDEVIYKTQVVDSPMTRSHNMRSKSLYMKMITSFKSEPTVTYNMLLDGVEKIKQDAKKLGSLKLAKKKNRKFMWRNGLTFLITALVTAGVEALVDTIRDDDDDDFAETFLKEYLENAWQDVNPTNKTPLMSEIESSIESMFKGYNSTSSIDTQILGQAAKATKSVYDLVDSGDWKYNDTFNLVKFASYLSGTGLANMFRDVVSILDWVFGTDIR